jgi:hypothetical protein
LKAVPTTVGNVTVIGASAPPSVDARITYSPPTVAEVRVVDAARGKIGVMNPPLDCTGPLNVVFAIVENLRVIAHPRIVSITSARSVDTSKKFLDVLGSYYFFRFVQHFLRKIPE